MSLKMVKREEWGAIPPCHQDPLATPIKTVAFVPSASLTCLEHDECRKLMRFLQRCNMGKYRMADIKHNFYIARDGTIYEGRGWLANTMNYDPQMDEPDCGMKGSFITIARFGLDFFDTPATPEELEAKEKIIKYGIENKYISPDYEEPDSLFYHYVGDSCPPENPPYKVWEVPEGDAEKERMVLYNCTNNNNWVKQCEWEREGMKLGEKTGFVDPDL